jgi:hypothetical protein
MIPVLGNHIIAQLNLEAAYVGKTVAPNELPAMNSTMPARNWQRPPKNRMTPTRILGVAGPMKQLRLAQRLLLANTGADIASMLSTVNHWLVDDI